MSRQIVSFAAILALVFSGCAAAPDGPSTPSTSSSVPSAPTSAAPGQTESASPTEAPAVSPSESPSVASPELTPRQLDPATYTPPAAAFEMLGVSEAKPGHDGDHLDFSGVTTEELALYEAFNTAMVPTNSCHLYELPADPTAAVAPVQDFVDCLHASWAPWLEEHDQSFESPPVAFCRKGDDCDDGSGFPAWAAPEGIFFTETFVNEYGGSFDSTMAHEYAHVLQYRLSAPGRSLGIFETGTEPLREQDSYMRRVESQAECVGMAMYFTAEPVWRTEAASFAVNGDEGHYDKKRHEFWLEQATKGKVGECNAMVAAPELVLYEPESEE